jgi:hypothetical protein
MQYFFFIVFLLVCTLTAGAIPLHAAAASMPDLSPPAGLTVFIDPDELFFDTNCDELSEFPQHRNIVSGGPHDGW